MTDASREPELPDLFRFGAGGRAATGPDWRRCRTELLDLVMDVEYGRLPPTPEGVRGEELIRHRIAGLEDASHVQYRLLCGPEPRFRFMLDLLIPAGEGPFPVMLTGDACWRPAADEIAREGIRRRFVLAEFNRVEIAPDNRLHGRDAGLYRAWPDGRFGALTAWAWGYHRCVDFLSTLPGVDAAAIAAVGHSRGGKAALLAGATDERIALTGPNNSGCGGAGCFRRQGPKSETLADILRTFPFWFHPDLGACVGREDRLPFDQHAVKALVAPRALLTTEALGDLWANPTGTMQTHRAAREVYRFLGAEDRLGIRFREGPHRHGLPDWSAQLDFAEWVFRDRRPGRRFDEDPFPDLPPAHAWSAPPAR
jgi:hypothetical protein